MSDYEIKYISISRGEGAEDLKLSMDEARKLYHELDKLFGSEYSMATTAPYTNAVYKGEFLPRLPDGQSLGPRCGGFEFKQAYENQSHL